MQRAITKQDLLAPKDVAERYIPLKEAAVRQMMIDGKIRAKNIGRKWYTIEEWVQEYFREEA